MENLRIHSDNEKELSFQSTKASRRRSLLGGTVFIVLLCIGMLEVETLFEKFILGVLCLILFIETIVSFKRSCVRFDLENNKFYYYQGWKKFFSLKAMAFQDIKEVVIFKMQDASDTTDYYLAFMNQKGKELYFDGTNDLDAARQMAKRFSQILNCPVKEII